MSMNKIILNYVESFFYGIPYSKNSLLIKEKIIEKLEEEYHRLEEKEEEDIFEKLVSKYNNLYSLAKLADIPESDIDKIKAKENATTLEEIKNKFKTERKNIYTLLILLIISAVYAFNTIMQFSIFFVLLTALFVTLTVLKYKKDKRKKERIDNCSIDAYSYVRDLYDKYSKKTSNSIFIGFTVLVFLIIYIIELYINSKTSEIFGFIYSNILYVEIIALIIGKNSLLTKWLGNIINDSKVKKHDKYFKIITGFSFVYWIICLAFILILKTNYYMNIFFIFTLIYLLFVIVYILRYRKKVVYQNFVINKKRIVVYTMILIVLITYQFMQREFWLTQPYINSIPNIYEKENKIEYEEATGIYTITNDDEGEFKILQLTDIHLGGSIFSYRKDMKALKAVYELIDYTKPDLVIVTGDLTFPMGIMSFSFNNHTPVMQFASFMRNIGTPWAFTYGNHDTEAIATYSKQDLDSLYKSLSYKTSKNLLYPYTQPDITGRNNQLIEIRNADGTLNQAIFLIDSNAYTGEGINKYDYIHEDQVEWYENQILRLKKEKEDISSMIFFHIPLQQYRTAYELYEKGSSEVEYYFGSNDEKMIDKVCASDYPSTMFDKALELGSTKGFFCGHDHYNNMSLGYKGIRLTYGMSIDYLAMPGIEKDSKQRGGTLITLNPDSSYKIEQIPLTSINNLY